MDENELVRGFGGLEDSIWKTQKYCGQRRKEIWGKVALETDFRLIKELAFCSKR